jgi:acyl-CoA synthetase (AMP-forming)/AMP-acid ligase II
MTEEASVTIDVANGVARKARSAEEALRTRAANSGGAPALVDSPNRELRRLGPSRSLTFAQANAIVDLITGEFDQLGLSEGDVSALQVPNTVEAPLLILAAWRAGLVPCVVPLLWGRAEMGHAFTQVRPAAVVTIAGYGDECPAACTPPIPSSWTRPPSLLRMP